MVIPFTQWDIRRHRVVIHRISRRLSMSSPAQVPAGSAASPPEARKKKDRTHVLYVAVIAAVVLGAVLGLVAPGFAQALKPLGDGFIALIKMMIAPIIFCTIVLGVGSIAKEIGRASCRER